MILLQQSYETSPIEDALWMFLITMTLILGLVISGKINLGIYLPGVPVPLRRHRKAILKKSFPYYNLLPDQQKRKFEQKIQHFIRVKHFIPRNMNEVTEEMKVLISACAVQLTFGYPKVTLSHFKRILIYPTNYYSTINLQYHKGEVNPRVQAIVLSWDNFVKGYMDLTDGRNLGLHEMAHALHLEDRINNSEYDFLDKQALQQWNKLAMLEINRINQGNSRLFRDYAGTNLSEFFSVAVENFFERPAEFKNQMPQLYANLTVILRQDPLQSNG